MEKDNAIRLAVDAVNATKQTHYVLRRGDAYDASVGTRHGWKVAEMISTGNVHNFRTNASGPMVACTHCSGSGKVPTAGKRLPTPVFSSTR